jgi:hypothetical protein
MIFEIGRSLKHILTKDLDAKWWRLRWTEPAEFRKKRRCEEKKSYTLRAKTTLFGVGFLLCMFNWYTAKLNPQKKPVEFATAILLSLFLGWFLAFVVPWLSGLLPSDVVFAKKEIRWVGGSSVRRLKYADIRECHFAIENIDEKPINTMVITLTNGNALTFGVPDSVSVDLIRSVLIEKNDAIVT